MRRQRLVALALAAGPLLASAQSAGQIVFSPDSTISASECAATSTETIQLAWTTTVPDGLFTVGGSYAVYASNKDFGTNSPYCFTADDSGSSTFAAKLATEPANVDASFATIIGVDVGTPDVVAAAGLGACTADGTTVYVCVQWLDSTGAVKGYAKGTVTLAVSRPNAPLVRYVQPGNDGLVVDLTDQGGAAQATTWRAKAVNANDANDVHLSDWSGTVDGIRIGGLTNGTFYDVTAFARSGAPVLNVSDESAPYGTSVAAQPVLDAWQQYQLLGGRDSGGCRSGPAGLAALAAAAVLFRLRRRS